jgi:hypothetical protein
MRSRPSLPFCIKGQHWTASTRMLSVDPALCRAWQVRAIRRKCEQVSQGRHTKSVPDRVPTSPYTFNLGR